MSPAKLSKLAEAKELAVSALYYAERASTEAQYISPEKDQGSNLAQHALSLGFAAQSNAYNLQAQIKLLEASEEP